MLPTLYKDSLALGMRKMKREYLPTLLRSIPLNEQRARLLGGYSGDWAKSLIFPDNFNVNILSLLSILGETQEKTAVYSLPNSVNLQP